MAIERKAPLTDVISGRTPVQEREERMRATVAVPGKGRVRFDEMTRADHVARLERLNKLLAAVGGPKQLAEYLEEQGLVIGPDGESVVPAEPGRG